MEKQVERQSARISPTTIRQESHVPGKQWSQKVQSSNSISRPQKQKKPTTLLRLPTLTPTSLLTSEYYKSDRFKKIESHTNDRYNYYFLRMNDNFFLWKSDQYVVENTENRFNNIL